MLLKRRTPSIDSRPAETRQGFEHLDTGAIAVLRWLKANRIEFVLVGPVAAAIRGEALEPGPVAIVPSPYRRNVPRRLLRPRRDAIAHVPVQLVVPTRDRYIPLGYYELAEQHAPSLRPRMIDGSQWPPRTDPDLAADSIASFIEEVEEAERAPFPTDRSASA